jgi:hypothetical protein
MKLDGHRGIRGAAEVADGVDGRMVGNAADDGE